MSSNQRPTGVRVISSQGNRPTPARRHGDPVVESTPPPSPDVEEVSAPISTAAAEASSGKGDFLILALLFVIGCAIGGAALSLLGLGAP